MDYKTAAKEIGHGRISPLYLCYGPEKFFRNEFVSYLIGKCLQPEYKDFALSKYDLAETSVSTVIEDAETLPFMAERKVIVANNALFFTGAKDSGKVEHKLDRLMEYIQSPADYTVIVFTVDADKLDERKKIVKALKEAAIAFQPLSAEELTRWVQRQATAKQFQLDESAAERLILNTGGHLQILSGELEKLSLFAGQGGSISLEQVESLVARSTEQNVFLLIDEVVHLRLDKAFAILHELIRQKEEPIKIMALLARQFRIILQVKELSRQGYSSQQIASQAGVHPYAVKLAAEQARKYESARLLEILSQLSELDYSMKSGGIDKLLGLEMFLLKQKSP